VFVSLYASLRILYVKIELSQLLQNEFIYWNPMIAYNNATVQRNITNLFTPLMIKNLLDSISFCWIDVEYLLQKIFELGTYEVWQNVLT